MTKKEPFIKKFLEVIEKSVDDENGLTNGVLPVKSNCCYFLNPTIVSRKLNMLPNTFNKNLRRNGIVKVIDGNFIGYCRKYNVDARSWMLIKYEPSSKNMDSDIIKKNKSFELIDDYKYKNITKIMSIIILNFSNDRRICSDNKLITAVEKYLRKYECNGLFDYQSFFSTFGSVNLSHQIFYLMFNSNGIPRKDSESLENGLFCGFIKIVKDCQQIILYKENETIIVSILYDGFLVLHQDKGFLFNNDLYDLLLECDIDLNKILN